MTVNSKNFANLPEILWKLFTQKVYFGVQSTNNAYHNVNKVQNSFLETLIWNFNNIVVCVVFALYSSIAKSKNRPMAHNKMYGFYIFP